MNDILKEYYGLELEYSREYNGGIIFFVNGDYFYLCKCELTVQELNKSYELYLLLKQKNLLLHDFIFNNESKLLSNGFVLLKLNYVIDNIDIYDLIKIQIPIEYDLKDDFFELWTNKIDYLEEQFIGSNDNKIINYSLDYFVGIAEALLVYYKDNVKNNDSYVVHRTFYTLSTIDFYNPLNIVLGDRCKDIAFFVRLTNDWELLYKLLNYVNFDDKVCIFVRLSFPFYYFNLIYGCCDNKYDDSKLIHLVKDIDKYEQYLKKLEGIFGINLFFWIKKDN